MASRRQIGGKIEAGGYKFKVKRKSSNVYLCNICNHLIREYTELPCSHGFCKSCLKERERQIREDIKQRDQADQPQKFPCQVCGEEYISAKEQTAITDKAIFEFTDVLCQKSDIGCKWFGYIINFEDIERCFNVNNVILKRQNVILTLKQRCVSASLICILNPLDPASTALKKHYRNDCLYATVQCQFQGCTENYLRKDRQLHEGGCLQKEINCEYCQIVIKYAHTEKHNDTECQLIPTVCSHVGCQQTMSKREIDDHEMKDCFYRKVTCSFHDIGCTVQVLRKDLEKHEQESHVAHTSLILKEMLCAKSECTEAKRAYKAMEIELQDMQRGLKMTQDELGKTQGRCNGVVSENDKLRKELVETKAKWEECRSDNLMKTLKLEQAQSELKRLVENNANECENKTEEMKKNQNQTLNLIHQTGTIISKGLPLKRSMKTLQEIFNALSRPHPVKPINYNGDRYNFVDLNSILEVPDPDYTKNAQKLCNLMNTGEIYTDYFENVFFKVKLPKKHYLNAKHHGKNLDDIRKNSATVWQNRNMVLWDFAIGYYILYLAVDGFDYENSEIEIISMQDNYQSRQLKFAGNFDIPWDKFKIGKNKDVVFFLRRR